MDTKFMGVIFILIVIGVSIWSFSVYFVTKYQMNNSKSIHDCGHFERYEVRDDSSSGRVKVINTYIYIKTNSDKNLKFIFDGRLHKQMSYIETNLKPGQELCFDYIVPLFKGGYGGYGETFLKSIQIERKI